MGVVAVVWERVEVVWRDFGECLGIVGESWRVWESMGEAMGSVGDCGGRVEECWGVSG